MNRNSNARLFALFVIAFSLLSLAGCDKCDSVTLKTVELDPTDIQNQAPGSKGSKGVCLSEADPPLSSFSAGAGQALVGFDNFFKPGTQPFPCDDFRAQVFRSAVVFDLKKFDSITSADLLFDTQKSIVRSNGETTGSSPPKSFATVLGMVTSQSNGIQFDNDVPLPAGPSFSIGVSSQVRDWVDNSHSNLGFSLTGPTGLVDHNNIPENNDAKLSWYGNFRLRIVYNPKQNPNAPQ
jgi:hypothetical protein